MFKIGVGPSSSHTLGPWRAALAFRADVEAWPGRSDLESIRVDLFGSLAKTGRGHGTDLAVQAGLLGLDPVTCDLSDLHARIAAIASTGALALGGASPLPFHPSTAIVFHADRALPFHPNAVTFTAEASGALLEATWYSIGGGFIVRDGEPPTPVAGSVRLPYPIDTAADLLRWCDQIGRIGRRRRAGQRARVASRRRDATAGVDRIWQAMRACLHRGCHTPGQLPGGLRRQATCGGPQRAVARRAGGGRRRRRLRSVARRRPVASGRDFSVDARLGELLRAGRQRRERLLRARRHGADQRRRGRDSRGAAVPHCLRSVAGGAQEGA